MNLSIESSGIYLKFLNQIGSRPLLKAAALVPIHLWEEDESALAKCISPRPTLKEFRVIFWQRATETFLNKKRFSFRATCEEVGRSPEYFSSLFRRHPECLVWLLKPVDSIEKFHPLTRSLFVRLKEIIETPLTRRCGTIKVGDARVVLRAVELVFDLNSHKKKRVNSVG